MKNYLLTFILFLCICSSTLFHNCVAVITPTPIPIGDESILKEIPTTLEGIYEVNASELFERNSLRIGKQYIEFKIIENTKLLVKEYYSFTEEDIQNDSISNYYSIKEDILIYHNDSLYKLREQLATKRINSDGYLNESDTKKLKKLDHKLSNGTINDMFSLQHTGDRYEYDFRLLYELNLSDGQFVMYTKDKRIETLKAVLKQHEKAYFISVFNDELSNWNSIIIEEKEDAISIQIIDPRNIQQNEDHYKSMANYQPYQANRQILIDPSKAQFEVLLNDPKFLIEVTNLKKEKQIFSFINDIWLPIIIIVAFFIIFLAVRTYKVLKS